LFALELSFTTLHNVLGGRVNERETQMSNDTTQNLPIGPSFEERVFARFDLFEQRVVEQLESHAARLDEIDGRLHVLEQKAYDTRPIWERAIAEILELREDVHTLDRKFNIVTRDLMTLRAEQSRLEDRMDKIDSNPA
jgi:chromosome segregation ATPase